jgi:hypothetical protein
MSDITIDATPRSDSDSPSSQGPSRRTRINHDYESTYGPEPEWVTYRRPARSLPEQDGINWNYASTFDRTPARVGNRSTTRFQRGRYRRSSSFSETDVSEASRPPSSHNELNSLERVQTVWCPTTKQNDVTLHFSLDIADDIEGLLEEFSRLKRLGHFTEALEYFDANLQTHLDLPLVAIEYADLLAEQGAYQRLRELRLDRTLESPGGKTGVVVVDDDDDDGESITLYLYRVQFQLVELWGKLHSEGISRQALKDELNNRIVQLILRRYRKLPLEQDDRLDSTEVSVDHRTQRCVAHPQCDDDRSKLSYAPSCSYPAPQRSPLRNY